MNLFRLDASFQNEGSHSRAIADIVEAQWTAAGSGEQVVRRHIGAEPIPATYWAAAAGAGYVPAKSRTDEQLAAVAYAAELVDELVAADALLFAVPLYNFGVSQHFKAYVDLVITDPRMGPGTKILTGKPAELVVVRGGNYRAGTPREGWDHATPWMRRILEDAWGLDLTVTEVDFTLVGLNPALDEFKEMAAEMRSESERIAHEHGTSLAQRVHTLKLSA
jgi:FMN-dependent NADH-azoreductase